MLDDIMVDLETLGVVPNSAILAIGAVKFNKVSGITDRFYERISLQSCVAKGLYVDDNTVKWWMKQSDEAKSAAFGEGANLKLTLQKFRDWIGIKNAKDVKVWGNGADFDNVILRNAFMLWKKSDMWMYYNNRCFRTVARSFPEIKIQKVGVKHNALDDAINQANYLIELNKKYGLNFI